MQTTFITDRLTISLVTEQDGDFILELVNSKGWLEFIGDRNVHSKNEAIVLIKKINNTPDLIYWVVRLKTNNVPLGIISFLKREYLEHFDIGFAFLPKFAGNGYAYEATKEVLSEVSRDPAQSIILATTMPGNINSTRLLKKLGLHFDREIKVENETLHVYSRQQM